MGKGGLCPRRDPWFGARHHARLPRGLVAQHRRSKDASTRHPCPRDGADRRKAVTEIQSRPEFKWWDALLGFIGLLLIVGAWLGGLATNLVNLLLMAFIPVALVTRVWAGLKGKLEPGFI